jgi:hypothetical protein
MKILILPMSESYLKELGSGMIIEELKNRWWRR